MSEGLIVAATVIMNNDLDPRHVCFLIFRKGAVNSLQPEVPQSRKGTHRFHRQNRKTTRMQRGNRSLHGFLTARTTLPSSGR